eukprot:9798872-Karenia_brevis.AAC.1
MSLPSSMRTHGSLYPPQGASSNWCSSVGDHALFSPKQNSLSIPVNRTTFGPWAADRAAGIAVPPCLPPLEYAPKPAEQRYLALA